MSYIGINKVGKMYLGSTAIGKAYLSSDLVYDSTGDVPARTLPTGYKECKYIENTIKGSDGAYIDTNILGTSELRVVCKLSNGLDGTWPMLYGVRTSGMAQRFECFSYSGYVHGFSITGSNFGTLYHSTSTSPHTIDINKYRLIYDGVEYPSSSTGSWVTNLNFYICGYNEVGNRHANSMPSKYYYFKIYSGETLVRDYVPAYQESSNKYGFYDFVSNTFFASANSTNFSGQIKS